MSPRGRGGREFGVMVVAGVSAGKSTLLNALIGAELLHSANQATTARLARIEHDRNRRRFAGTAHGQAGELLARESDVGPGTMRRWNEDQRVRAISAIGRFPGQPREASGLVLYDTPGPNNSLDHRHGDVARDALRNVPAHLLFHIMDAGHPGTTDDRSCLEMLRANVRPGQSVCFVLNKIDLLDEERGESQARHVQEASRYLQAAGFAQPTVIPTMADGALCARKVLHGEPLTRAQHQRLLRALAAQAGQEGELECAANVSRVVGDRVRQDVRTLQKATPRRPGGEASATREELQLLVARSGIGTIEHLIRFQRSLTADT